jgi:AraC-like DNA-binding protein
LRKIFEKKLGVSPKEYMISLRMEYAKQLLSSGEVGVAEAAQMCGYAEPCHFSREFKKRFGISPKNYK